MRIESKYAAVLHIAAEEAAENAALRAEAEWAGATIAGLVDENERLHAVLDDMQAEWAAEWTRAADTMRTLNDAANSAITASNISLNVNQGLLDRIAEMEQLDRQQVIRADEQADEIARLERELEASKAAHAATCEAWRNDKDFRAASAPKAPSVPRRDTPGTEVEV